MRFLLLKLAKPVEWIGEGTIWGGKFLLGIFVWPFRKLWLFLPFRKNIEKRKRRRNILILVFIFSVFALLIVYPNVWNYPYNQIEPRLWGAIENLSSKYNKPQIKDWASKIKITKLTVRPFLLGLDLQGGTQLVYEADLHNISPQDSKNALESLRDVIERRVNLFGVREPQVQLEKSGNSNRLLVELAGIKDINQAINALGKTPFLEFREERSQEELDAISQGPSGEPLPQQQLQRPEIIFKTTKLTGQYLKRAELTFDPTTRQATVGLRFNDEGKDIFKELTARNVNKRLAIFLDGYIISAPTVQQEIPSGEAVITGTFSIPEAQELVRNLNAGALPVPINLISQQSVGATLGQESLNNIMRAGVAALIVVVLFMLLLYRVPGAIAVFALCIYSVLTLAIFKLLPVTFTLPGIAGFILSIGMAVDANILIFARMKEERRWGRSVEDSIEAGFVRAWPSIRDSNIATLITTSILYFLTTSFVRGFALTLGIGVLMSMFSAVFISRLLLLQIVHTRLSKWQKLW
ncbi:MAG: protein-export membrane protein SecD [Candidatus Terrybacteria bacterium RIFCSPLOWO2_01_FULL_44_24]|nr:MAG: protein-export membrane protein SecD [Candidatus Terrybacteria bacterium RIFCSPHIGHO2_02_FULL_43_14]OHA51708.1 MAG: protein-export membrane protein SecD [Candidatus Terrybacteria bacterium RIFCSPLOWO2_01_FULL_44_24]